MSKTKDQSAISRDFARTVVSVMGVPVDKLLFDDTVNGVLEAIDSRQPTMLSTANLNFMLLARRDSNFQHSLVQSDLVTLDGVATLWVAKILGISGLVKVSGSNLFENLIARNTKTPIKAYLFGGDEGVAQDAHNSINTAVRGVVSIGFKNPGFGTAKALASIENIDHINAAKPDFLVVSLGAQKGQEWLLQCKDRLDVPVISHLGAVLNFAAGSVRRAPKVLQNLGLEWLWRIKEQPRLFARYFKDGLQLIGLLIWVIGPYRNLKRNISKIDSRSSSHKFNSVAKEYTSKEETSKTLYLSLSGHLSRQHYNTIKETFEYAATYKKVCLDIKCVNYIDEYGFGLILILLKHTGSNLTIRSCNKNLRKLFEFENLSHLLTTA